jgi:signal recognition particle GTPase
VRVNLTPSENITDTSVFVSELYNQKMDIQYEFKEEPQQTQDLLKNLEKENKMLKNTNQVYLNHIKKICKCVQSTEIYLENKFLNEENEERTISKKIFNILISSDTLEEAREQICKTLYKMSYQDYTNQKSIEEEISNNYSLCAQCLIWYNEGKTICDCGKCVKFD